MMNLYSVLVAAACCGSLALVTGCHHAPARAPANYDAYPPEPAKPAPPPAPAAATSIRVSRDILDTCKINDSQPGKAPLFAFDSSALSRGDQRLLAEVAQCFESGPLAARSATLVGRADPRGTEDYNLHLGDRRANAVAGFLEHHGMAAARLSETSRGALDATGHDESGWTQDRRVDVGLAM
jgi:outer membrane protein OmpA-like peptidoglycan-associated protein